MIGMSKPQPVCICTLAFFCPLTPDLLVPDPSSADVGVKLSIDAVTQAVTLKLKIAA